MNPNILVVTFFYVSVTSKIFYRNYEIDTNADDFREITDCFDTEDTAVFLNRYVKENTDLKDCWNVQFSQKDYNNFWNSVKECIKARRLDPYGEYEDEYSALYAY